MADVIDIRADLASLVRTTLQAQEADYKVVEVFDPVVVSSRSRDAIVTEMASGTDKVIRYAQVVTEDESHSVEMFASGVPSRLTYRYSVNVLRLFDSTVNSQLLFDATISKMGTGLLDVLRNTNTRLVGTEHVLYGIPEEIKYDIVTLGYDIFAHYVTFLQPIKC